MIEITYFYKWGYYKLEESCCGKIEKCFWMNVNVRGNKDCISPQLRKNDAPYGSGDICNIVTKCLG